MKLRIIIIIKNISPCRLIDEPQMRLCSSHLSNKNVFSNFRNVSKLQRWIFHPSGKIVPDCWTTYLEWPWSKCHCSGSWNVQLHWGGTYRRNTYRIPYIRHNPNHTLGSDDVWVDLLDDGLAKTNMGRIGKRFCIGNSDTRQGSTSADPMSG